MQGSGVAQCYLDIRTTGIFYLLCCAAVLINFTYYRYVCSILSLSTVVLNSRDQ